MSVPTIPSSIQSNASLTQPAKTQETRQSAEPKFTAEQKQAREAAAIKEAIDHIPMEPGAIMDLTVSLHAEKNNIGLDVALMRHKQETMETVLDGLKRSGS